MTSATTVSDPVCGMTVDPSTAVRVELDGDAYYFCESVCAETFRDDPNRWVQAARAES